VKLRAVVVLAVVAGTAGCSATAGVVVTARPPVTTTPPAPRAATVAQSVEPTTTVAVPAVATPASTVVAPTNTVTTPPAVVITSHAAQLDQLPGPTAHVPVAVAAGDDEISGPVVPTGVDADTGELALPAEAKVVAWYQYGPAPGAEGSAVLAGHVDWHGVPGIFFRLRELQPGDGVVVTMSDGTVQSWKVVDVTLVAKPELPVSEVFSRTGPPTLTLVTCGGSFDYSTHHYRSNVVVTAVPS
jgi:LPXTG-site transpeptidase (sortase) family protein